ncbi:MAG: hypothetical protein MUP57_05125 [Clostridia bacterium]|nr:hypothetical protein [Clostridia bacterium]
MKYKLRRAFMAAFLIGSLIFLYFLIAPGNFQPPVFAAQLQKAPQEKASEAVNRQPVEENKKKEKEPEEKDKKVPQNKEAEDDKDWTG